MSLKTIHLYRLARYSTESFERVELLFIIYWLTERDTNKYITNSRFVLRTKVTKSNYAKHLQVFWNLGAPLGGVNQFTHPPLLSTFRCALTRPRSHFISILRPATHRIPSEWICTASSGKQERGKKKESEKIPTEREKRVVEWAEGEGGDLALLQTL